MSLIFVYGTLKRNGCNHRHLSAQKFLGEARTVAGFRLFEAGGFPGMVASPSDREGVTGEVWSVDAASLAHLDDFEGVAEGLYVRSRISLLPSFAPQNVDAYFYARSVAGRSEIGSVWRE